MRYNQKGDFNTSFHLSRNGMKPETLAAILTEWSRLLNERDVIFECRDFTETPARPGDFVYCDPPYANSGSMYFGSFDTGRFFAWLARLPCGYAFSFDGTSGETDNTFKVPEALYSRHLYLESGNSSFRRIVGHSRDSIARESIYLQRKF